MAQGALLGSQNSPTGPPPPRPRGEEGPGLLPRRSRSPPGSLPPSGPPGQLGASPPPWEGRDAEPTHHAVLLQRLGLALQPGLQGHLLLLEGRLPAQSLLGVQLGQLGKLSWTRGHDTTTMTSRASWRQDPQGDRSDPRPVGFHSNGPEMRRLWPLCPDSELPSGSGEMEAWGTAEQEPALAKSHQPSSPHVGSGLEPPCLV